MENKEELVSIIMPTYNCAKFIAESIDSVIAQNYTNWELIIVDDCSKDNTKEILTPYLQKYPNIRYTCLQENGGPSGARTEALKQAKGEYVAFLDSDDLWYPEKLSKQISFMKQNNIAFSCTGYEQIEENGKSKNIALIPPKKNDYITMLRLANSIGNLTVVYNRNVVGEQQVPAIKKRNDFALWLQILHKVSACYGIPDILAKYRLRTKSVSRNKLELISYHWYLYYHIEKLNIIKSVWYIFCCVFVKVTGFGINKVKLTKNPGVVMKLYRIMSFLQRHKFFMMAKLMCYIIRILFGCIIPPTVIIGKNCRMPHGLGIVLHHKTTIGDNTVIYQHVTIGGGEPNTIGSNCIIGTGAFIKGPITIGNNVHIGANAVVLQNIPDNCTVVGVPNYKVINKGSSNA